MSNFIPFTGQRGKLYYTGREEIEVRGKPRERWVVVVREPDGEESYYPVKTKHDAEWMTGILRKVESQRRPICEHSKRAPLAKQSWL